MSTTTSDFQLVELKPLGDLEGMTPRDAQVMELIQGQSPVPSPRTHHAAAFPAGDRLRIRENSQAASPPLSRGEGALRDLRVSTREGCASSSSKKGLCSRSAIFSHLAKSTLRKR